MKAMVAGVVICVSFLIFYANHKDPRDLNRLDRAILSMTAPAQMMVTSLYRWGEARWQAYASLVDLARDNMQLKEEVKLLRQRLYQAREAELENRRLRRLLQLGERIRLTYRPARVVAFDPMSKSRTLRIDRGAEGGVERGQAVVTEEGVVGRIMRVGAHHADVLLITDTRSAIDSFVQRTRDQGTVEGLGNGTCRIKYLLRGTDIRDGDVIVTSGYDGLFPRGLPVGIIRGDEARRYGVSEEAELLPFVDLSRVEEVLILDTGPTLASEGQWLGGEP